MHNKFPLLLLLVALFAIVLFQGVSAVYSWDLGSDTKTATAWSNHKYLARVGENTLYATFVKGNNVYFTRSTNDGVDWNAPVILSTLKATNEPSVNPSLLIDSSGVLHIVWQDQYYNQTNNWEVFYRSCDTTLVDCTIAGNWSAITDISNDALENNYPLMAIDSSNVKHVIWQQNREIYYTKCASNCNVSGNWSYAVNVSNTATESYNPSIVVASGRNVGIVWEEVTAPAAIYYKTCASATADCSNYANWSSAVNVSNNDTNESFYARVAVDSADRTHIVWSETGDGFESSYTVYKSCAGSCDNSANWANKALVSDWNDNVWNEDAFIITDSSNKVHIFWLETANGIGNIRYRTRTSAGDWGGITELTNDASIGYLGISCNYTDFNPSANYEKLDCVWTNAESSKLVYFAITKDPVPISVPGDQGKLLPTHTYLTLNPTNLSGTTPTGANTITVTEFSIYSPYTFGAGTLLPWYYVINSTLTNYTFTIRLAISYLDRDNDGYEDITGRDENTLAVAYWDNGWTTVSGSVNRTNNYILITTNHFSTFSLASLDAPSLQPITIEVTPKKKNIKEDSKFDFVAHVTSAEDLSKFANATSADFGNPEYTLTGINYDSTKNQLDLKIDAGTLKEGAYEFQLLSLGGINFSTNSDYATVFRPGKK